MYVTYTIYCIQLWANKRNDQKKLRRYIRVECKNGEILNRRDQQRLDKREDSRDVGNTGRDSGGELMLRSIQTSGIKATHHIQARHQSHPRHPGHQQPNHRINGRLSHWNGLQTPWGCYGYQQEYVYRAPTTYVPTQVHCTLYNGSS